MEAKTVVVVDYGMGNLRSVSQAVQAAAQGTGWGRTTVALPRGRWRDAMTGVERSGGVVAVEELLAGFPVAVLERA